jgi:hypothetical protein
VSRSESLALEASGQAKLHSTTHLLRSTMEESSSFGARFACRVAACRKRILREKPAMDAVAPSRATKVERLFARMHTFHRHHHPMEMQHPQFPRMNQPASCSGIAASSNSNARSNRSSRAVKFFLDCCHINGRQSGLRSLVARLQTSSIDCLFLCIASDHSKAVRNSALQC